MKVINRTVAIIKPKKPYLDWIRGIPNADNKINLEELQKDCTCFLIPDYDSIAQSQKFVDKHFKKIFQYELSSWDLDKGKWPKELTPKMFRNWFAVEIHSMVIDIAGS